MSIIKRSRKITERRFVPFTVSGPAGAQGATGTAGSAATIDVGTTTTLPTGSSATVTNAGTSSAAIFNFGIPTGATGATGATGPKGDPGTGSVSTVSVVSANGLAGTVANATTTPAITLSTSITGMLKGNGTAISAGTDGTDYLSTTTGLNKVPRAGSTAAISETAIGFELYGGGTKKTLIVPLDATVSGTNTGDQTNISGNAATVTVAAETADTTCSVLFATDVSGSLSPKTNTNLTFDASTGVLTSASAVLTTADINGGTIDGTAIGNSATSTIKATNVSANAIGVVGTAGAGYIDLVAQSSTPSAPPAGTIKLEAVTTNGFTRLERQNEGSTIITYGRDNVYVAKNTTAGTITKGQPVYITGSTGNVPNIGLAKADSTTTLPCVGLAADTITAGNFGQVMTLGILSNINTNTFTSGDTVYVATATAGGLVKVRPSGKTNIYVEKVGEVLVAGVGNGSIKVNISPFVGNMETGTVASTFAANAITGTTISASTGFVVNSSVASTTASGLIMTATAAENLVFGDVCYLNAAGKMRPASALRIASASAIGMALAPISANASGSFLLHGTARGDSVFALNTGAMVYLNTNVANKRANCLSTTAPGATDNVVQILGWGLSSNTIYFNPNLAQVTHS